MNSFNKKQKRHAKYQIKNNKQQRKQQKNDRKTIYSTTTNRRNNKKTKKTKVFDKRKRRNKYFRVEFVRKITFATKNFLLICAQLIKNSLLNNAAFTFLNFKNDSHNCQWQNWRKFCERDDERLSAFTITRCSTHTVFLFAIIECKFKYLLQIAISAY